MHAHTHCCTLLRTPGPKIRSTCDTVVVRLSIRNLHPILAVELYKKICSVYNTTQDWYWLSIGKERVKLQSHILHKRTDVEKETVLPQPVCQESAFKNTSYVDLTCCYLTVSHRTRIRNHLALIILSTANANDDRTYFKWWSWISENNYQLLYSQASSNQYSPTSWLTEFATYTIYSLVSLLHGISQLRTRVQIGENGRI